MMMWAKKVIIWGHVLRFVVDRTMGFGRSWGRSHHHARVQQRRTRRLTPLPQRVNYSKDNQVREDKNLGGNGDHHQEEGIQGTSSRLHGDLASEPHRESKERKRTSIYKEHLQDWVPHRTQLRRNADEEVVKGQRKFRSKRRKRSILETELFFSSLAQCGSCLQDQ